MDMIVLFAVPRGTTVQVVPSSAPAERDPLAIQFPESASAKKDGPVLPVKTSVLKEHMGKTVDIPVPALMEQPVTRNMEIVTVLLDTLELFVNKNARMESLDLIVRESVLVKTVDNVIIRQDPVTALLGGWEHLALIPVLLEPLEKTASTIATAFIQMGVILLQDPVAVMTDGWILTALLPVPIPTTDISARRSVPVLLFWSFVTLLKDALAVMGSL